MKTITTISLLFVILIFSTSGYAQIKDADKYFEKAVKQAENNKPSQAVESYKRALDIYEAEKEAERITETQHQIALLYAAQMGDWKNAEIWLQKTLASAQKTKDMAKAARVKGNIGIIYDKMGKYALSEKYHQQSLVFYAQAKDTFRILVTYKNMGMLYLNRSNYSKAEECFSKSLAMAQSINNTDEVGKITYNIGFLNYKRGNYGKASLAYKNALSIMKDNISDVDKAEIYNNLGIISTEYGDSLQAFNFYFDALSVAQKIENKDIEAKILNNIGNLYLMNENYLRAIKYYSMSLDINMSTGNTMVASMTLNNIGIVYQKLGDYEEAKNFFDKSKELKDAIGYLWGSSFQQYWYAQLYLQQKKYPEANIALAKAAALADSLEATDLKYKITASQGAYHLCVGDTATAINYYAQSIDIIEKMRLEIGYEHNRLEFMESVIPIYKTMIEVQLQQRNVAEAYNYVERMKTRNLLEILHGTEIVFEKALNMDDWTQRTQLIADNKTSDMELRSLCTKADETTTTVTEILDNKRSASSAYASFAHDVMLRYPTVGEKMHATQPLKSSEVLPLLVPDTEAALVYMTLNNRIICFVLRHYTTQADLVAAIDLPLTNAELKSLTTNIVADWEVHNSTILYDKLIRPMERYLQGVSKICIVPDGYLHAVPFQALQSTTTGKFMLESYAIYYDYSLSLLKELRTIEISNVNNVVAFGNPDFSGLMNEDSNSQFNALPRSEEEVMVISRLYADSSAVFLNKSASEYNFKQQAGNYKVLHLATHGVFDNLNPMYSSLILAASAEDDGVLTAAEVLQLDLNANLVVLSACETARGIVDDGEGLLGLSRAFLGAKVPTIVATQWQVDDQSTKLLMEEFYKNVRQNVDYTEALRLAQLHLRNNTSYKEPFFWAPFVVIGASR